MFRRISPLILFLVFLIVIGIVVSLGPKERTLGANVRLVYLHGAWVWTALISFMAAALFGIAGLVASRPYLQRWSLAWGQVGTFFWITYLPISLWTMQANWNGLYLDEPRWRIGIDLALIGLLLQAAIVLWRRTDWASALNGIYFVLLLTKLVGVEQVMHPPSPIFSSQSSVIPLFFSGLVIACLLTAWQLSRWLFARAAIR
ncbi:MAG: hypothetical protein GTO14_09720 [Anaerolineales bacterium]|nr:hypothetical protein [Anaerolineales bacterium]